MAMKSYRKALVFFVVLLFILAGYVSAGEQEIQEKLNKEVKVELKDVTIAEALDKIGKEAGVEIELSDEAEWKLPAGAATRISVLLEGSLSEGLSEMLNSFFMRYVVGDEKITIYPRPELKHIIGRTDKERLKLLKDIYSKYFRALDNVRNMLKQVLGRDVVLSPISKRKSFRHAVYRIGHKNPEEQRREIGEGSVIEFSYPLTLSHIFDSLSSHQSWYISGAEFPKTIPEIVFLDSIDFRKAKLNQIIDISFKDKKAKKILDVLSYMSGMELRIEKKEPSEPSSLLENKLTVNMQNVEVEDAIRNIINTIGIRCSINPETNLISVFVPPSRDERLARVVTSRAAAAARRRREVASGEYVGKISIPMDGGKYFLEFMLREGDLPKDLKALRDEKIKEILGKARTEKKGDSEKGGSDD